MDGANKKERKKGLIKKKKGLKEWKVLINMSQLDFWHLNLPHTYSIHAHTHKPQIHDREKALLLLQQPAVIIWWLFNLFY